MADHTAVDLTPISEKQVHFNFKAVALAAASMSHVRNGLKRNSRNSDSWHRRKSPPKQISLEMCISHSQSSMPLHVLAGEGKLEELKSSIDAYELTLKETDQNGCTLLHHAAAHNQVTVMQYLIDSGINLDDTDNDGNTALHLATSNECVEACHLLLSSGASDTVLNKDLDAPLHIAARGKNKALAAILNHQVEYLVLGYRSRTPLHVIAEFDNIEGVKMFNRTINSGVNKNRTIKLCAADDDGLTPMHLAARKNSHRTLEFFINCCSNYGYSIEDVLGFLDEENSTPLHAAVDSGNFEVAEVLLKHGASPIVSRGDLIPPLHLACSQGRAAMVKAMVELAGCEIVAHTDQHRRTPLHYCALSVHSSCMINYIAEKARSIININAQDDKGRTPLHNAITSANLSGTTELLSYGANPMLKDKHGFNALHIAVHRNRKVIVSTLLGTPQAAELATAKSSTGYSALHLALRLGHGELIPGLISALQFEIENNKDDNGDNYLHLAASRGDVKALKSLLDVPAIRKSLNEPNNRGATPLHLGAYSGQFGCVQLLLNNGAMVHRCFNGNTAFNVACRKGYTDCAKLLLLAHPSQLNLTDDNGNSALHAAAQSKIPSMVTLVLDEGCKLTVNSDSKSFFDLIIDTADFKCAMAVVNHDRWQECLDFYSPPQPCPMVGLIQQMPKVAKVVLDRCYSKAENLDKSHRDYWELFDFKYLLIRESDADAETTEQQPGTCDRPKLLRSDSTVQADYDEVKLTTVLYKEGTHRRTATFNEKSKGGSQCSLKTMKVLENMMAYKRVNLLTHPVVNAFLSNKWRRYGRFIYNSIFLFHFLMVFLLSVFVLIIPNPVQILESVSSTDVNETDLNNTRTVEPHSLEISTGAQVLRAVTLLLNVIFLARIGLFLIISRSRAKAIKAFRHISLWINLLTGIFNFIYLVAPNTLEIWPVGAVACFFSWLSLLFGLEHFTMTGTIVKMIVAVTKTVVLVLLMCVFMLLAFAFSFYILAGNLSEFSNVGYSFISVFGFMLGELPYESYVKEDVSGNLIYGKLFLVFILVLAVLMSIVIANLLIGLAIGDIERIKLSAILDKKATEIYYFSQIDKALPKRLLRHCLRTTYVQYPNAKKSRALQWLWQESSKWIEDILEMETERTNGPCPTATTDYVEEISQLKRHILDLKETVQQLQDITSLHWRKSLLEQQSTISLNSFDMDFMEDFASNGSSDNETQ